jgi:hypothetical protein
VEAPIHTLGFRERARRIERVQRAVSAHSTTNSSISEVSLTVSIDSIELPVEVGAQVDQSPLFAEY